MATTVIAEHTTGSGYDVLLDVSGMPITVTFHGGQPTESELADRIAGVEERLAVELMQAEIEANIQEVLE